MLLYSHRDNILSNDNGNSIMRTDKYPGADRIYHIRDIEVGSYKIGKNGEEIPGKNVMMTEYWLFTFFNREVAPNQYKRKASRMFWRIEKYMYENIVKKYERN